MDNLFITLINNKKINNLEELKQTYRKLAKKTHPDLVGSDKYLKKFIQITNFFEEAKQYLESNINLSNSKTKDSQKNYRLLFYIELYRLNTLELMSLIDKYAYNKKIKETYLKILSYFREWKTDCYNLFLTAGKEYLKIKFEKQKNNLENLRKPTTYKILRPAFFNLSYYNVTGIEFYKKQFTRSINSIEIKLEEYNFSSLNKIINILIEDLKNGPAVFTDKI
jgi:curved DNA-binding protein CbpA